MNPRLIRALQRGGVTAEIGVERWGVWRSRDRRGRVIGVLTGAEIDVLRARESLKPLGDGQPPIFIWPASLLEPHDVSPSAGHLQIAKNTASGPLIELILTRMQDTRLRALVRETVRRYRADAERASGIGVAHGMNWDGLALGGKIDGGRGHLDQDGSGRMWAAQTVQSTLLKHLGGETIQLLDRLILSEDSRAQMIKRLGGKPPLLEGTALAAIRALHEVYRDEVRRID